MDPRPPLLRGYAGLVPAYQGGVTTYNPVTTRRKTPQLRRYTFSRNTPPFTYVRASAHAHTHTRTHYEALPGEGVTGVTRASEGAFWPGRTRSEAGTPPLVRQVPLGVRDVTRYHDTPGTRRSTCRVGKLGSRLVPVVPPRGRTSRTTKEEPK